MRNKTANQIADEFVPDSQIKEAQSVPTNTEVHDAVLSVLQSSSGTSQFQSGAGDDILWHDDLVKGQIMVFKYSEEDEWNGLNAGGWRLSLLVGPNAIGAGCFVWGYKGTSASQIASDVRQGREELGEKYLKALRAARA